MIPLTKGNQTTSDDEYPCWPFPPRADLPGSSGGRPSLGKAPKYLSGPTVARNPPPNGIGFPSEPLGTVYLLQSKVPHGDVRSILEDLAGLAASLPFVSLLPEVTRLHPRRPRAPSHFQRSPTSPVSPIAMSASWDWILSFLQGCGVYTRPCHEVGRNSQWATCALTELGVLPRELSLFFTRSALCRRSRIYLTTSSS